MYVAMHRPEILVRQPDRGSVDASSTKAAMAKLEREVRYVSTPDRMC